MGGPGRSTSGWGSGRLPAPAVPQDSGERGSSLVQGRGVDRGKAVLQGMGGKSCINQEMFCSEIAFPSLGEMQMIDKMIL